MSEKIMLPLLRCLRAHPHKKLKKYRREKKHVKREYNTTWQKHGWI